MDRRTFNIRPLALISISLALLSGCAGTVKNMREVPPDKAGYAPTPETAVIVFMRPSTMGFAIQSSVFDVTDEATASRVVGIVAAKKRLAHVVKPGAYRFMVVGESADFMNAEIEAGKTYYAFVTPRMGAWKARFSLLPIGKDQLDTNSALKECNAECSWVELSPDTEKWAQDNMKDIESKRKEYLAVWMKKAEPDRPLLRASDGR
jgi:hypothetical protein